MKKSFLLLLFLLTNLIAIGFCQDLTWNTYTFPDGFKLITKEVHGYPVCSLHLFVAAGSVNENPKINGISHFYEHLFFKGTKQRDAEEMKSEMEDYGGEINGETYRDYTEFIVDLPSLYADKGIDYLLDAFFHAALEPVEMEKERKVVLDEVSLNEENPQRQLSKIFDKTIYSVHPYRLPVVGTPESVKKITREDVLEWKNHFYVPSNATLIVAGDLDSQKIKEQVGTILNREKSSSFEPPQISQEPPRVLPTVLEFKEPVDQTLFDLGYLVAGLDTPEDIYPLDVLTFMLGYGRSSMLTREIKDKEHLALEVSADFLTQHYPSTFQITVACKSGQVKPCREKILKILDRVKNGEISSAELARAKTLLEGVYRLGNETDSGIASTIGFYASMGKPDFAGHYLEHIRKVTIPDLRRVAEKYFRDNYVQIIFQPNAMHNPDKTP